MGWWRIGCPARRCCGSWPCWCRRHRGVLPARRLAAEALRRRLPAGRGTARPRFTRGWRCKGRTSIQGQRTGNLMALATNDIDAVEMAAGEAMLAGFDGTLTLVLVVAMMSLGVDWRLAPLALLPFPVHGAAASGGSRATCTTRRACRWNASARSTTTCRRRCRACARCARWAWKRSSEAQFCRAGHGRLRGQLRRAALGGHL